MNIGKSQSAPPGPPAYRRAGAWPCTMAVTFLFFLMATSAWPSIAGGAQIVIVKSTDAEPYAQAESALRDRLVEHHHTVRGMLAKEITDKGIGPVIGTPDAVVAIGTPAARMLQKQLAPNIKLAFCMVPNAADAGLLQGRECLGVTTEVAIADQIKLIAEALPKARTIGTLYRSDTPDGRATLQSLRAAMPTGWRLEAVAAGDHPTIAESIDALIQKRPDVIWTTGDQKLYDNATVRALLLAALRGKIPVWGFSPSFVRAGARIGVGVDPRAQGSQAADLVMQLIAEPQAGKERVTAPREFQIAVNLIVAGQLGVQIPEALIRRGTFVFRPEK